MTDVFQGIVPFSFRSGSDEIAPRCTVGLLTWNAGEDGLACLGSLRKQTEPAFEMIWIDNASQDGTIPRLRAACEELCAPHVNAKNLGFCKPHNDAIAACQTRYYLALNQDVVLEPDYIRALCDWMDQEPELALTGGLILMMPPPGPVKADPPRVYSAGMAFPPARFAFELGMGGPLRQEFEGRRIVPGVDGAAMLLRVDACRRASLPAGEIFPTAFFAYGEEVDLAQRLARLGLACGIDGAARAWHRGQGSGGFGRTAIRAGFFRNHWLVTLRNDSWGLILREFPRIVRGEWRFWLPEYRRSPRAVPSAVFSLLREWGAARKFYRNFEAQFGPTGAKLRAARDAARDALRVLQS